MLLEDVPAALPILQSPWKVGDAEARSIRRHFIDRSLAQQESDDLRLHDLQLDYVRAQFADRVALNLIRGAMRLSAHVLARDPRQFASQVVDQTMWQTSSPAETSL